MALKQEKQLMESELDNVIKGINDTKHRLRELGVL